MPLDCDPSHWVTRKLKTLTVVCVMIAATEAHSFAGLEHEFSGRLSAESRWFPTPGAHPDQRFHASGFVAEPKFYVKDKEGRSLNLAPFFRYDAADPQRTHADLHEAYFLLFGNLGSGEWELRLGVDRVFWGVAESRPLVDIVNQTDLVEHPRERDKLGQPMIHLTWSGAWGVMEIFGITYHRPRTYSGRFGRLRPSLLVDNDLISYESQDKEKHWDMAARYSHSIGPLDIGLSLFEGTHREPWLQPAQNSQGTLVLAPHYDLIRQLSLDAQLTINSWLFKLEAIDRQGARNLLGAKENYTAFIVGGEYTFYSPWNSTMDLSLLAEWNHDGRESKATHALENDIFLATRLAFNDVHGSAITVGILQDMDYKTRWFVVEINRRLSDQWSLHLEKIAMGQVDRADLLPNETRRDSFIELHLNYNF